MSDNTLAFALIVWFSLLILLTGGSPDLLDHLLNIPVPPEVTE